jgi:hypothetical protein
MPTTPNLGISHIDASQNNKEVTANTAFDVLDTALTDYLAVTVTGAVDVTPAGTIIQEAYVELVGALTANINLIIPASKRFYVIRHSATGGHTINVKSAAAGTNGAVLLSLSNIRTVYCDGTNVILVSAASNPVQNFTAAATLFPSSGTLFVTVDATSAAFALTLPDATKCSGTQIEVKQKDASGNVVTVTGASGQNIDGSNIYALTAQYKFVVIRSDGTQWWIVASN